MILEHIYLRPVRVGTSVGHREEERPIVLESEGLIVEGAAVDRLAAGAVEVDEVATLNHEVFHDPVEQGAFVVKRFTRVFSGSGFSGCQLPEVFRRFGCDIVEKLDDDSAEGHVANGGVEEDPRSVRF